MTNSSSSIPSMHKEKTSGGREVPLEDFFVREFRAVQFDLNLFAVDRGISRLEERNGVARPRFGGVPLNDHLFEAIALVRYRFGEKAFRAKQGRLGEQSLQIGDIGADADLGEATLGRGSAIHLEVSGQFSEGHSGDHVEQTREDETEVVGMGGGVLVVGFGHPVRHGVDPLSLSSSTLYTRPARLVNTFSPTLQKNFSP